MSLHILPASLTHLPQHVETAQRGFDSLTRRKDLGFLDLEGMRTEFPEVQQLASVAKQKFTQLIWVGIGGSSIGHRYLANCFDDEQKVLFLDNPDPWLWNKIIRQVRTWRTTGVVLASKSGSTLEVLTLATLLEKEFQKQGCQFGDHTIVFCEPGDHPLSKEGQRLKAQVFNTPKNLGGRFSICGATGGFLLEYLGRSYTQFLEGASAALTQPKSVIALAAEALISFERTEPITFLWSYGSAFEGLGLWFQQLWAESLGQAKTNHNTIAPAASTPMYGIGACDQHSIHQQLMDGPKNKWILLLANHESKHLGPIIPTETWGLQWLRQNCQLGTILEAERDATANALRAAGVRAVTEVFVDNTQPQALGSLLMTWMLVVGTLGECLSINAFVQPGVELGKRLAQKSLAR